MDKNHRRIGNEYEELACNYLKQNGFTIVERNFYSRHGEIDIIAREVDCLVFVEVKYRRTTRYGTPQEAVTLKKQQAIRYTAKYYLYKNGLTDKEKDRFDVIGILKENINHIRNAF